MARILISSKDLQFISKFATRSMWQQTETGLYMMSPKSGARVLFKPATDLPPLQVSMPEELISQLMPGYYEMSETIEYTLLHIYSSATTTSPIVVFRIANSLQADDYREFVRIANATDFNASLPARSLIAMYSIVSATHSSTSHTLDFHAGQAYFTSPKLICWLNKEIADKNSFSINKDHMWFLTFANDIKMKVTAQFVCLQDKHTESVYTIIFYKTRVSDVPEMHKLQNRTPIQAQNVNLSHFGSILQKIKPSKHIPPKIIFNTNGLAVVTIGSTSTVIPVEPQTISFAVDAMIFKNIAMKLGGIATMTLYDYQFTLKNKDITIVGRWEAVNELSK